MRYETPEVTALTPAINAIQTDPQQKNGGPRDSNLIHDVNAAYADWED